jgi:hypothetical protein
MAIMSWPVVPLKYLRDNVTEYGDLTKILAGKINLLEGEKPAPVSLFPRQVSCMIWVHYDLFIMNRLLPSAVELYSAQRLELEVSETQCSIPSLLTVRSGKFSWYLRGDIVVEFCDWLCGFHHHSSIPYSIQYIFACVSASTKIWTK